MSNINKEQQRSTKIQSKSVSQILQNIEKKRQNSQKVAEDSQVDNDSAYIQQDAHQNSKKIINNKARSLESRLGQFSPYKQSEYLQKKRFSGEKQESESSKQSHSSERYKTLVDSNNRKNYQIWIKSDSIVRIPKSIRQSQEKLVQIQDQTSINYEINQDESPGERNMKYSNSQQDYIIKLSVRETALAQNKQGFPRDKTHIAKQIQQNQFETCDMNTSQHVNLVSLNSQQDEILQFGNKLLNNQKVENAPDKYQIFNESFQKNNNLKQIQNKLNDYSENHQIKNEKKDQIYIQLNQINNLNQSNSEVVMKDIGSTQIFIESAKFSENKHNQNQIDSRFEIYSQEINQKFGLQIPQLKQTPQNKIKQQSEKKREEQESEKSQLTDQTEKAIQKGNFQNAEILKTESFKISQQNDSLKTNNLKRKAQVINSKKLSIDKSAKIIEVKENKNTLNYEKKKKQLSPAKSNMIKITKQIGDEISSSATISVHQNYMNIEIFEKPVFQNDIRRPSSGQQQYDSDKEKEINENKKSQQEVFSQQINGTASQETILNQENQMQIMKKNEKKLKNIDFPKIEKKPDFKQTQILIQKPPQISQQKSQKNQIALGSSQKIQEFKYTNDQKSMHVRSEINLNKQKNIQSLLKYEHNSHAGTEKTAGHRSSHNSFQKVKSIQHEQVKNHEEEIKLLIDSFQQNQIKNEIVSKTQEKKQIQQKQSEKIIDKQILKPVQQIEEKKNISKYAQTSEKLKNDMAVQKNTESEIQSKLKSECQKKHERTKQLSQQFQILNQSHRKSEAENQNSDSLKKQFTPIAQTIQSDDPLKNNDLLSVPESKSLSNHPYFKSEGDGEDFTNRQSMMFRAHISDLNRDYQSLQERDGQKLSKFVQIIDKDIQIQNQQEIENPIDVIYQKTIEQNQSRKLIQEQDQRIQSLKKDIISTNQSAIFGANPEFNQIQIELLLNNENEMNKTISSKQEEKSVSIKPHEHVSQTARIHFQNIQNYDQNSQGQHSAFKSQQTMNYIMPYNQDSIFRNNFNQDSIQQSSVMVSSTINLIQEHNVNFQNVNGQYAEDAVINGDSYFIWQGQEQRQQSVDIDVNDPYKLKRKFQNIQHKKQLELTKVPIINIQANIYEKTRLKDTSPKSQQKNKNQEILVVRNEISRKSKQENNSLQNSDQMNNDQLSQVNILTIGSPKMNSQISTQNRFKNNHNENVILAASYNMREIMNERQFSKQTKKFENIIDSEQSNMSTNNKNLLNNENYFPVNSSNDQNSFFINKEQKRFKMQSLNQYYNSNKNRIKQNVFSESGGDNFKLSKENRYSRKILSVEPLPNQIRFGSNDFLQDRMIFKQDETEFSNKNTLRNQEQLKLEPQFNLKNFIRKNNLQKILINDFNQKSSIYDFHKNNQFQGGYKNQGPMENQNEQSSRKHSQNSQLFNFRQQVKQMAMKNQRDKNYQYQQNKKDNLSSSRKRHLGTNSSEHDEVFENGLINIEQAFMLIQYIKRSQGAATMSELEIVDYIANKKSLNVENSYMKNIDIQSQIKKFKWKEVMRFMKINPHIMMQLLSLNEIVNQGLPQKEEDLNIINVQVQKNQKEIQARQRYTDIVLNNMKSRIPPVFIQQQRQNLQQIANSKIPDPKVYQRRNLKILSRHNQHDLDQKAIFPSNKTKFNLKENRFRSKDSKNNQSIEKNQNSSRKQTIKINNQRISSNEKKLVPIQEQKYPRKQILPSLPADYTKNQEKLKKSGLKIQSLDIQKDMNTRNDLSILNQMFIQHNDKENRNVHHQKINSQMNIVFKTHQHLEDDHPNERFTNINYDKYLNPQSQMNVGSFQKMLNQNGAIRDGFMQKIDMKQYMSSIDMKKPKTNQVKKRPKKTINNQEQLQDMNSFSINMKMKGDKIEPENNMDSMEHTPRNIINKSQPDMNKKNSEELYKKLKSNPLSKQFIIQENLTVEDQMQIEINKNMSMFDSKTNKNMYQDKKSEFSNQRTSYIFSRNEELNKQKQMLENEESELIQQRKQIQSEKDKITRMLQRLDKKQELVEKEEQVKKQRMILEIEKKKLRDDIQELDDLKNMLEQKKKDNLVGFSDLAESNKEMRSLKSGDLHKDRQFMLSKQSLRSRRFEFNKDTKLHSGSQANHRMMSEENKSQVYGNPTDQLQKLSVTSNNYKAQQEILSITDQSPLNINKINIYANNQIKQAGSEYDANHQKRCKTVENDTNEVNDYQDANNTNANIFTKQIKINEYDSVLMKSVENKHFVKKNFTQIDENSNNNMQGSVNSKWQGPQNVLSSPMSQSNMTFITGNGVFDWSNSLLMEDILQNQIKFKRSYISIDKEQDTEEIAIFSEEEIFQQIDQIKISHKNLRNPEILDVVFDKAYYTLETLMCYMNQSVLFEIISEKYQEITIDNCVKLLVRCKQVLESRQIAFETLKQIVQFEQDVYQVRVEIDSLLENSQNKELMKKLKEKTCEILPGRTKMIIGGICKLRDQYKLFNKIAATTSKGNQVLNIMAYKKRDAYRYIMREYEAIKRLVQVVDIQMPNLQIN